jgi:hypothetical protein
LNPKSRCLELKSSSNSTKFIPLYDESMGFIGILGFFISIINWLLIGSNILTTSDLIGLSDLISFNLSENEF